MNVKEIFKVPERKEISFASPNPSMGILDDFAVRKNIATMEGTIEKVPVNPKDIVNKAYADGLGVDWTVSQAPAVIHADNYTDTNTTDHTALSNIGTQTHAQLETAIDLNTAKVTNATHTGAVTGSTALTITNDAVTYAKMQNVSATDKVLGRATAGAGDVEEIACTAAGRALIDDANAAAQLTTLGAMPLAGGTFTGLALARAHGTAATDEIINVCYGTADPPAANTTTEGALFVKYTA